MSKQQRIRVVRTTERRSPEQVRRLGRALIALARAEAEAEAQAQAEAGRRPVKPATIDRKSRKPRPQHGDAA